MPEIVQIAIVTAIGVLVAPMAVYLVMKLGTMGYLAGRRQFRDRHHKRKDRSDGDE